EDEETVLVDAAKRLTDSEIFTLYSGADVDDARVQHAAQRLRAACPRVSVEVAHGGQPHYPFIVAAEEERKMNAEQIFQSVLKVLHIGTGVFWVGTAWFFFGWIEPTTKAIGPQAGPFIHHIVRQRRVVRAIVGAGAVNVLVGAILYWRASAGLNPAWIGSGIGIGFTIGAIAAI